MEKLTKVPSSFKKDGKDRNSQVALNPSIPTIPTIPIFSSYTQSSPRTYKSSCSYSREKFSTSTTCSSRTTPKKNVNASNINTNVELSPRSVISRTSSFQPATLNVGNLSAITEESLSSVHSDVVPTLVYSQTPSFITTENCDVLSSTQVLNVSQYSNQTLNLDLNSQQILKAILQQSTSSLSSEEGKDSQDNTIQLDIATLTKATELNLPTLAPLKDGTYASLLESSNEDSSEKEESPKNKEKTFPTNTEKTQPLPCSKPVKSGTNEDSSKNSDGNSNVLPVAAINVSMIDGKPFYTIQLMGQTIPLAAITVPTSEGTLKLQSCTTALTSSQVAPVQSSADCISSASNINTTISDSTEQASPVKTYSSSRDLSQQVLKVTKPKYTCDKCGKSYVRGTAYYSHLREHEEGLSRQHKCYICSKVFSSASALKTHLPSHTEVKGYVCTLCNQSFPNTNLLKTHQLKHAHDAKKYECQAKDCGKVFANPTSLRVHQRVHQEEKPFVCSHNGCGKSFKTASELTRHEFRHTGAKPYKCDACGKAFVRNDDLKRHFMTHTGQKKFKCDLCDFSCIQSFDLVKHKYIHGGDKPFKCDKCPKQFTRPARLREHQRLHTGERPYACDECGKTFTQLPSLRSHKLTHTGHKAFQCEYCERQFVNVKDFKNHVNTHLGVKQFSCDICGKEFISEKTLKRHVIVHTGEKPFSCEVCQRGFARSSDLKLHMLVHSEDKPFKCSICTKSFTRYNTLKEHIRSHTGNYPFTCPYCEKEFNHRSHFNVHIRTHTGERPHKCTICSKEFTRKMSLRRHMGTHGINTETAVVPSQKPIENQQQEFAESTYMNPQQVIIHQPDMREKGTSQDVDVKNQLTPRGKRKRRLEENIEDIASKRQMISYEDQMLSGFTRNAGEQYQQSVESMDPNVLATQSVILSHGAPVLFNLADIQQHNDGLQSIDTLQQQLNEGALLQPIIHSTDSQNDAMMQ